MSYSETVIFELNRATEKVNEIIGKVEKLWELTTLSNNRCYKPSDVRVITVGNLRNFIINIRIKLVKLTTPLNFLAPIYKEKIIKALNDHYKTIPSTLYTEIDYIFSTNYIMDDDCRNPIAWDRLQRMLIESILKIPFSYFDNFLKNLLNAFDKNDSNFKVKVEFLLERKIINANQKENLLNYSYCRNAWGCNWGSNRCCHRSRCV